jgi:hypothetical protein
MIAQRRKPWNVTHRTRVNKSLTDALSLGQKEASRS